MVFKKGDHPWNKGKKMSTDFCRKNSEVHKGLQAGEDNPFYGKHHSKKTKERIAKAKKGKHCPKLSDAKKGCIPWNKGLTKKTDERVRQGAEKLKGRLSDAQGKALSKTLHNLWRNPKYREKMRKIQSANMRKLNNDDYIRRKRLQALSERPNNLERRIIDVIKEFSLPFRYVGDGSVIIERLCPDFLSLDENKIIEVFGDYWHKPPLADDKRTEEGRRKVFAKHGYDLLVLWESELSNMNNKEIAVEISNF